MKFVWPALISIMEEREKKIADGLEAADRADKDLELAKKNAMQQMHTAKQEAAAIIEQANKRSNQIVEEAKDQAVAEGNRLKAAAQAQIEQDVNRAKEELRNKVSVLVLAGAEKVLGASIDEKANSELVDQLAAQL
tara:strand:- start:112 stop:519 length:408 start_codon:yes stop_codon:yes gene_type:complete